MGRKRRGGGHYCWVCGKSKSNESFSGKGHSKHICKKCAALSPEQRKAKEERSKKEEIRRLMEGEGPYGKRKGRQEEPAEFFYETPYWHLEYWDGDLCAGQLPDEIDRSADETDRELGEDELPF